MLSNLLIKNYALIRHLEMKPSPGLNIITGETGAGKSIMLGAIGLLMGKRADTSVLLQKEQKCVIEGTFNIEDYSLGELFEKQQWDYHPQTIIRREINANGKSRAFINDSPVNLDALKSLGVNLMDIHSQNETLKLGARQFQLKVLDVFGQTNQSLANYQKIYGQWTSLKEEYQDLLTQSTQQQRDADYREFLLNELETMALDPLEQETLEDSLRVMEHAEEIKLQIQSSLQALDDGDYSANQLLAAADQMMRKIRDYSPQYGSLHERLDSVLIELKDIIAELQSLDQQVEHNPEEIESAKTRLDSIYRLQKKHGVETVQELIDIRDKLIRDTEQTKQLDETLKELEVQIRETEAKLLSAGAELSGKRKEVFPLFRQSLENLLAKLGMPEATVDVISKEMAPGPQGLDDIQWLFSANKGIEPQPISKVASGGEFSRLMFCVKYLIADKVSLPTIVFDEIDAGISGEIALQMIEMMHKMAASHQVMTISHLPQFAAKGHHHYYVYKESEGETTTSGIRRLQGNERIEEIAKMLGGNNPSEIAYANAKELMKYPISNI